MNNDGIPNDRKDDLKIMNSTGPSVVRFLQISIKHCTGIKRNE